MKIPLSTPKTGDPYPLVRYWCQKLGVTPYDQKVRLVMVDRRMAAIYVAAILGERFDLRFRKLPGSVGRGGQHQITLDRVFLDGGKLSLGTVLHECAHAIQHKKLASRRTVRREIRERRNAKVRATRTYQPIVSPVPSLQDQLKRKSERGHGEAFCRTYAKLLRAVLD